MRQVAFADVFKVAETSRVLAWDTSTIALMAMRTEPLQKGQEMHNDASVFKRAPPHGGKSPKLKRSPVRGVKKVSVKGERVQDWPFSFNFDFF